MPTSWKYLIILSAALPHMAYGEDTNSEADAFGELPETYITATRNPTSWLLTPGSGALIQRDAFLQSGGADFGDVAKYDPTVSAPHSLGSSDGTFGYGQTGYSGYNIRGIEGNRILMLVDNIRQPEQFVSTSFAQDTSSAGGAGRDYYDPAMFETTEILKGAASALYGSDALGGVVAYRTPEADDFLTNSANNYGGLLRGQYFSKNDSYAGQAFFAFRQDDISLLFGYAGRTGHETENNGETPPNPADFNSDNYLLKLNWEASDEHAFGFTYEYFKRDRSLETLSADGFVNIFDKEILNWEQQERNRYSLSWDYSPTDVALYDSIESLLYFQNTSNSSINHSESVYGRVRDQEIDFDTRSYGVQSTFRKQAERHQFTYGLDFSMSRSENRFYREDNGLPPYTNRISFAPTDTMRAAVFLQDQFQPSENSPWRVIGGLRLDYYQITPDLSADYLERISQISSSTSEVLPADGHELLTLSPRLDLIYQIDEETSLYAQYSHGVRNPTAEELSMIFDHPDSGSNSAGSITLPNPSLEEEKSDAFELGYKHQSDHQRLLASAFYTRYSDFIENGVNTGELSDDGRDIITTVNRGRVDIYGFELGGSWELGHWFDSLDGLEVGVSTGRTWGIDREEDTWLNTIEPWKTVAWIGYTAPSEKFGLRLTGTYVDGVKHVDDSSGGPYFRPPSYFNLDASGFWKITDSLTLQAGINNILDEQYWQWSNTRKGGSHISNASSIDDRSTAPGVNGFLSLSYQF
ncbi:TonB-dependent hemoglobin/transferrin/lactoferrin family receptor [Oceaniferula flava]|nr:TonB-dependent hemoglobin/transferrin/lactoferrin family receptor [Oceaniferula flavus]